MERNSALEKENKLLKEQLESLKATGDDVMVSNLVEIAFPWSNGPDKKERSKCNEHVGM